MGAQEELSDKSKKSLIRQLKNLKEDKFFGIIFLLLLVLAANFIITEVVFLVLGARAIAYTPISGSMVPTLNIGDLLIIQGRQNAETIYAHSDDGEIIIFYNPNNPDGIPIVHRAIDKYQIDDVWYIETKGDHNNYKDPWKVTENYLIGKVIFVVPMLGNFLRLLDESVVNIGGFYLTLRMIIIFVLISAFIYLEFTDKEEKKESRNNKREDIKEKM